MSERKPDAVQAGVVWSSQSGPRWVSLRDPRGGTIREALTDAGYRPGDTVEIRLVKRAEGAAV